VRVGCSGDGEPILPSMFAEGSVSAVSNEDRGG
jgi:hypothetical protein